MVLPKIKDQLQFITHIRDASLDDPNSKLSKEAVLCLRNPSQAPITIEDLGIQHSIIMYLALKHSS